MINRDIIRNVLIITLTFIIILSMIIFLSFIANLIKEKDENYYVFGKDKIPSINLILGKRELSSYKKLDGDNIITKIYKYKNIKDPKSDLSNYVDKLKNDYNYLYTSEINLKKSKGKFQLGNNSIDSNKILIIDFSYDKDSYTIKITKGDGKINSYK
ncbi:MAG: hypothetical protein J6O62_03610 [Bacilli bacterium]|nr:hypothetical protein [Bacilli bacterium]MBO6194928.1 hypothetical protein [Bacilli bacterium]